MKSKVRKSLKTKCSNGTQLIGQKLGTTRPYIKLNIHITIDTNSTFAFIIRNEHLHIKDPIYMSQYKIPK